MVINKNQNNEEVVVVETASMESWKQQIGRGYKRVDNRTKQNVPFPKPDARKVGPSTSEKVTETRKETQQMGDQEINKRKYCHFFVNRGSCKFGSRCKFDLATAPMCRAGLSCRISLCMFSHPQVQQTSYTYHQDQQNTYSHHKPQQNHSSYCLSPQQAYSQSF